MGCEGATTTAFSSLIRKIVQSCTGRLVTLKRFQIPFPIGEPPLSQTIFVCNSSISVDNEVCNSNVRETKHKEQKVATAVYLELTGAEGRHATSRFLLHRTIPSPCTSSADRN